MKGLFVAAFTLGFQLTAKLARHRIAQRKMATNKHSHKGEA